MSALPFFSERISAGFPSPAQGYLDESGVPTILQIDDAGGMDVGLSFVNPARLMVDCEYLDRSKAILEAVGVIDPQETQM